MWVLIATSTYERDHKWYGRKKPNERDAVVDNLDLFVASLEAGANPKPFLFGFLHPEPSDVIAIDQTGAGAKLAATRLYVYADAAAKKLYLLAIGDKRSQHADIQMCKRFVEQVRKS